MRANFSFSVKMFSERFRFHLLCCYIEVILIASSHVQWFFGCWTNWWLSFVYSSQLTSSANVYGTINSLKRAAATWRPRSITTLHRCSTNVIFKCFCLFYKVIYNNCFYFDFSFFFFKLKLFANVFKDR